MKKLLIFLFTVLFLSLHALSQGLPDSLRIDWSTAGYSGSIPEPSLILNVKDFGAYGDSIHDDYTAIMNAVNSTATFRVIFFPAGNYLIKSSLHLPSNVVLRGAGAATNLIFKSFSGNCISIDSVQAGSFTSLSDGYIKGSSQLTLSSVSNFTINGYAELREANGSWDTQPAAWATYNVGQIVKVTAINGNTITIEPALHITYSQSLQPQIRPVAPKQNVGIECLKISRTDTVTNQYGYNINFNYASNCWVTGVESNKSQGAHIMMSGSSHITVSGCYFHEAYNYDGTGTAGYGVTMIAHNSDCKVENSIFRHLRHSMVAKQGANGNVFAYNYSLEPNRTEIPADAGADMLLHGHYAFANLFEGNIGQTIMEDETWGPSGPYNTFFKNRAEGYGIIISNQAVTSDKQNIIGNEVTNTNYASQKGNYIIAGNNQLTFGNNINSSIQPAGTDSLTIESFYLHQQPYFWNITSTWPSIGIPNILNSGSNPAKERYLANDIITSCSQDNTGVPVDCNNIRVNLVTSSISCSSTTDGAITLHASGGKLPFLFSIDSLSYQRDSTFINLGGGRYSIWMKDSAGCADTLRDVLITKPTAIVVSAAITSATNCLNNGSVTLKASGGVPPYLYSISDTAHFVSTALFAGIGSGSYTGRVKDSHGCIGLLTTITVGKTGAIILSATKTATSNCLNDGSITIKASGGTAPYTYSLTDTLHFVSTSTCSALAAGTYTGYVKDSKGCIASLANIVVSKATAIVVTASTTISSLCINDATLTLKASGGTSPFLYSLNDTTHFVNSNLFSNLASGAYTGYVKDVKGCIGSLANIVVKKASAIAITATRVAASSCKDDGTITLKASGGNAPYQYSLNDSVNFSSATLFTNLTAGSYKGWVRDAKGCTAYVTNLIVSKTATLTASGSKTNVTCQNGSDGTITLKASGGTLPYVYSLDGSTFVSTIKFTGLSAVTYSGTIKDAKGCLSVTAPIAISNGTKACSSSSATIRMNENNELNAADGFHVSIFPNPSSNSFHLKVEGSSIKETVIVVTDILGRQVKVIHCNTNSDIVIGENFPSGSYIAKVIQGKNIEIIKLLKEKSK